MPKGPEEYRPPVIRLYRTEGDVPPAVAKDQLNLQDFPKGELRTAWINMVRNDDGLRAGALRGFNFTFSYMQGEKRFGGMD